MPLRTDGSDPRRRLLDVFAPVDGVCSHVVAVGSPVRAGAAVVLLESMKTEHPAEAPESGTVDEVLVAVGEPVVRGSVVARLDAGAADAGAEAAPDAVEEHAPLGLDRLDLAEVLRRRSLLHDEMRPEAVTRRRRQGRHTVRSLVGQLLDTDSFSEYGGLAVAAQRGRREIDDLIERTPADGLLTGTGTIDGVAVAVIGYDATVLAGTQGFVNHRKTDRILAVVERHRLPVVLFAEGGGGRPGDVDAPVVTGLDVPTFARFARLSGRVPTVAVVSGYCFAGNAALVGCCDVIVATEDSNLGMAGPAMIEGGGLGRVEPTAIGPIEVQVANGTVDVRVADDGTAVAVARTLIGLGATRMDTVIGPEDQTGLRDAVPAARKRLYDVRSILATVTDPGTLVELRSGHAPGMVTALGRIAGRAVGVLANDPAHLGGAIDAEGATSATRLVQLCQRWGLPVVSFCDTPGFMVGPDAEATGPARPFGDLFVAAASLDTPWITVILRKAYGLGAQAMAAGGMHEPVLTVAWPTGELGGMGLEGAVRLGFARELDVIEDPAEREEREAALIELAYLRGGALNVASHIEIDDVIDPADTRRRILDALTAAGGGGDAVR